MKSWRAVLTLLLVLFASGCWRKAVQLSAGGDHNCGLRRDDVVVCWGRNDSGQCNVPDAGFSQVSAGDQHTCGIRKDGKILCWGSNSRGQSSAPDGTFTQVRASIAHTCGLRTDRVVVCWGGNDSGETAASTGRFVDVATGDHHTCAIAEDGSVRCWGDNSALQSSPPAGKFIQVSAGKDHSCALAENKTITCWGAWLPPEPTEPAAHHDKPVYWKTYAPDGIFTEISAQGQGNCAMGIDGFENCWDCHFPKEGGGPLGFSKVWGGSHKGCGLWSSGKFVCWGGFEYKKGFPPRFAFWPLGEKCKPWDKSSGFCD